MVTLLIQRGARVNATNMGDDTPLHLATAHGHRDIVNLVLMHEILCHYSNISVIILLAPEEQGRH